MERFAWPAAFAFAALWAAIALMAIYSPPSRDPRIVCIEQRGKWVGWPATGTCEFPTATISKQN